jgi:formate hydrogenlyase subunit 3/multisubunit Na+/H+ antiporter MnhD subunit
MVVQVDLKKLIAYATVQEMGLILILLLISNKYMIFYTGLFIVTHTVLSSLFFFIVDCVYKRYKTRTTVGVYGVFNESFFLGIFILISLFLYLGFPFTIKFFIELKLFLFLFSYNYIIMIILIFLLNFFGSFFFAKIWFNVLFGLNFFNKIIFLRKSEHIYSWFFIIILVVLPYISTSL